VYSNRREMAMTDETTTPEAMGLDAVRAKMEEISATFAAEPDMRVRQPYRYKRLEREHRRMAEIIAEAEEREGRRL